MENVKLEKVWTEEDIRKELQVLSKKMGLDCSKMKIRISKRMTSKMGLCRMKRINNTFIENEFVFSYYLLNGNYSEEVVKNTIGHEYIHFYTTLKEQENCHHDHRFKMNCIRAGIDTSAYFGGKSITKELEYKKTHKYTVVCQTCGNEHGRMRFSKGIEFYEKNYRCARCRGLLKVTENY